MPENTYELTLFMDAMAESAWFSSSCAPLASEGQQQQQQQQHAVKQA
jgi:hypothetical protein